MWEPAPGDALTREGYPYAVYYLFDHDLEPAYIGRTNNVMKRLAVYSNMPWWHEVAAYSLEFFRTFAEVFNAERAAILEHAPRFNMQKFEPTSNPPESPPRRPAPRAAAGPRWLGTGEAARLIGVDGPTLSRWGTSGMARPASLTMGGHFRWDLEDLRRQLREAQERQRLDSTD